MIVFPVPLELRLAMPLGSFEAHALFQQLWVHGFQVWAVEFRGLSDELVRGNPLALKHAHAVL